MKRLNCAAVAALFILQTAMFAKAQDQGNPPPPLPPAPHSVDAPPPPPPSDAGPDSGRFNGMPGFGGASFGGGDFQGGRRFNVRFRPRMVKATFLGVAVAPADPTLRAQLKLADGTGLAVINVDKNGPAKDSVQEHDVLYKLDDQLLINPEQLVVLVRMHKPGDSVTLTVIREAQPTTVSVKLVEHAVPELPSITQMRPPPFPGGMEFGEGEGDQRERPEIIQNGDGNFTVRPMHVDTPQDTPAGP